MNIPEEGENKLTDTKLQGYAAVLSIGSTRCKANMLGMWKDFTQEQNCRMVYSLTQLFCTLTVLTRIS